MSNRESLSPTDVFTPGRLPIRETNVYASRGEAESDLKRSLDRGLIPIVFGEFGVGKTSLARHHLLPVEATRKLIHVESVEGLSMSNILQRCLEHIGYTVETTSASGTTVEEGATGGGSLEAGFGIFKAKLEAGASGQASTSTTRTRELVVRTPSDSSVLSVCEERGLALILDELHRATRPFIEQLGAMLKVYANKNCENFKIVLVGTASDATRLIDIDEGIDRLLQEVHLKAMTDAEAEFVINEGMERLEINIPASVRNKIVRAGVGSPSIIQYLCLEVAGLARQRNPHRAMIEDFQTALRDYVRRRSKRLHSSYVKAIETIGPKRYRKQILHALAEIEDEYATMEQIRERVEQQLAVDVSSTALSGPLRSLKTVEYGPILKDVERHEGGDRVYNYTTFVDPAMKSFIRLYAAGEDEGVLG